MQMGFTLIELILVMVIMAVAAALVIPSLRGFTIARTTDNATTLILSLAEYARVQAVSEGRDYRLNFDTQSETVWLTVLDDGTYGPPNNDYNEHFKLPKGMVMTVSVVPQPNTLPVIPTDAQQITAVPIVPFGQPVAEANSVVQIQHTAGTYIDFFPNGRTDPALIILADQLGKQVNLGNQTSTEAMHLLSKEEMQ
jgi:prepilin-type N-terminal cleavage/methylation domain-containing protein